MSALPSLLSWLTKAPAPPALAACSGLAVGKSVDLVSPITYAREFSSTGCGRQTGCGCRPGWSSRSAWWRWHWTWWSEVGSLPGSGTGRSDRWSLLSLPPSSAGWRPWARFPPVHIRLSFPAAWFSKAPWALLISEGFNPADHVQSPAGEPGTILMSHCLRWSSRRPSPPTILASAKSFSETTRPTWCRGNGSATSPPSTSTSVNCWTREFRYRDIPLAGPTPICCVSVLDLYCPGWCDDSEHDRRWRRFAWAHKTTSHGTVTSGLDSGDGPPHRRWLHVVPGPVKGISLLR